MLSRILCSISPFALVIAALALTGCGGSDTTTEPSVETGADLVKTNACGSCHTSAKSTDGVLSGQDVVVTGTKAYGPNITPDKDTGIGSWTDQQIIDAIRKGTDDEGQSLCAVMPRFASLSDADMASMVLYLRSIPAVKRSVPESMCE